MTKLRLTPLAFLPLLFACAAPAGDDAPASTDDAALTAWSAVLRCNGAVVDVDATSRRHLQVVVTDPAAVHWLSSHPGAGGAGLANAKHEVIVSGWSTHDVVSAADVTGFDQLGFADEDALLAQARVTRQPGGLLVRLVTRDHGHEVETANWFFRGC